MAEVQRDVEYAVWITERADGFELRIRELCLIVRAPSLQKAYDELTARKQAVVGWARTIGETEVPPPDLPPPLLKAAKPL